MHHPRSMLAAAALVLVATVPAEAIDFDCAKARAPTEAAICTSTVLSRLDERMARYYGWLWAVLDDTERVALRSEQRAFLSRRNACAGDLVCINTSYVARIDTLSARLRQATAPRAEPDVRHSLANGPAVRG